MYSHTMIFLFHKCVLFPFLWYHLGRRMLQKYFWPLPCISVPLQLDDTFLSWFMLPLKSLLVTEDSPEIHTCETDTILI